MISSGEYFIFWRINLENILLSILITLLNFPTITIEKVLKSSVVCEILDEVLFFFQFYDFFFSKGNIIPLIIKVHLI